MCKHLLKLTLGSLIIILTNCSYNQDRKQAEQAVINYMTSNNDKYIPKGFGEFFEQTYPKKIQEELGTTEQVKYSLVHSYLIDGKKVQDEYFHLDKEKRVIGHLSNQQMMKITIGTIFNSEKVMNDLDSGEMDTIEMEKTYE